MTVCRWFGILRWESCSEHDNALSVLSGVKQWTLIRDMYSYSHVGSDQCICRQQAVSSMATPRRDRSPRRPSTTEDVYALREKLEDVAGKLNVVEYNLRHAQGMLTDMDQFLQGEDVDLDDLLPTLRRLVLRLTQSIRVANTVVVTAQNDITRPARETWAPAGEYPWPW